MSNRRIRGEEERRAAVRAGGRKPGPLQALHDFFDRVREKRLRNLWQGLR